MTDVMVVGITGKLGRAVAEELQKDDRYNVMPYSVGRKARGIEFLGEQFTILTAEDFESDPLGGQFVVVDASNLNQLDSARTFVGNGIPTLQLGTVGYRTDEVEDELSNMRIESLQPFYLLRCMNAAIPVISFINNLKEIGEVNPKAFAGCKGHVAESHQESKKSVPATAKKMKEALEAAGAEVDEIESVRDPKIQTEEWGVPEEYLDGHGYHRVSVIGDNLSLEWSTKVNGRRPYAIGVRDLILPALIQHCILKRTMFWEYR